MPQYLNQGHNPKEPLFRDTSFELTAWFKKKTSTLKSYILSVLYRNTDYAKKFKVLLILIRLTNNKISVFFPSNIIVSAL